MEPNSLETIEVEMALLIRRITAISSAKEKRDLDRAAYLLLRQISTQKGVGVKTLAHELLLDVSTVSRQAAALEKKGFVMKEADPNDGRAYFYQLTELGEKKLQCFKEVRLEKITRLLDSWPEEDRQLFGELLKQFNHELRSNA